MAKSDKLITQIEWEGADAARKGRGRSTNPYPQSDVAARNQWFAGYDGKVEQMSREERRPKVKSY